MKMPSHSKVCEMLELLRRCEIQIVLARMGMTAAFPNPTSLIEGQP
jgi:hypothetical protein